MSLNRKTLYKSRFYDEINDIIDFISENSTQGVSSAASDVYKRQVIIPDGELMKEMVWRIMNA